MNQIVFIKSPLDLKRLYPFSATRRVQDFRIGGLTIREKWETALQVPSLDLKGESPLPDNGRERYLTDLANTTSLLVRWDILPNKYLLSLIKGLQPGDAIVNAENEVLARLVSSDCFATDGTIKSPLRQIQYLEAVMVDYFYHLHLLNKEALLFDFELLTKNRKSAPIDASNGVSNEANIFIEEGAVVKHCFLNAADGPIYIGKDALVMEGTCLRGPVFIGERAVVKIGAKIYGATTVGPACTVGGEVKNCLFFANSNKAHDGYLGDSVIGEWCNFGAGTSCSNMKNNMGNMDFRFQDQHYSTSLKKCGLVMGDFSRTAINTSINTGTVIGVSAHVFGNGLTPKYIEDFSWGFDNSASDIPDGGRSKYRLDKALQDAHAWKQLKGASLSEVEKIVLTNLYNHKNY